MVQEVCQSLKDKGRRESNPKQSELWQFHMPNMSS